ncbi:tetratricopeptide repeat protein [cf. Phormidesmis sp. LEGE 11477]|uniref:tetratricopeptide repeat protein n=1 Tax=cf. Phormidesmis sp. LEGE 11477 TaxID=1828680 RepID=UPI001881FA02|nr:tetratricopeptide repeat protein [cf. Phormidesmis sp. LEGE 11477]MBE9062933.1 tetratricopeptide repeat protein [cf. Phormidesmis sp. LEGE 11477]
MRPLLTTGLVITVLFGGPTTALAESVDAPSHQVTTALNTTALNTTALNIEDKVEAERLVSQVPRIEPSSASDYANLGVELQRQSRYEEAEAAFRRTVSINPTDTVGYHNLGILLKKQNRYEEVEEIYREVLRINPDDATAHRNLAVSLVA